MLLKMMLVDPAQQKEREAQKCGQVTVTAVRGKQIGNRVMGASKGLEPMSRKAEQQCHMAFVIIALTAETMPSVVEEDEGGCMQKNDKSR